MNPALSFNAQERQRLRRFAMVGVTGTIVDFLVLILLKESLGLPTWSASTLAFLTGVVNNFILNRIWTYSDANQRRVWVQFGQFLLVSIGGVLLNTTIVSALDAPLGTLIHAPTRGYLLAKIIATGFVFAWNFIVNRRWTFSDVQ